MAVAVDIPRVRCAGAEAFTRPLAGERQQPRAVLSRVHVDASRRGTLCAVREVGGVHVPQAVAVHVAGNRDEHRAQRRAGVVGVHRERGPGREARVDVDAASALRAAGSGANHEQRLLRVREAGDRAAKVVAGAFTAQGQENRPVLSGEHVRVAFGLRRRGCRGARRRKGSRAGEDVRMSVAVDVPRCRHRADRHRPRGLQPAQHHAVGAREDDGSAAGRAGDVAVAHPLARRDRGDDLAHLVELHVRSPFTVVC